MYRPVYVTPERGETHVELLHESRLFELEPLESAALIHKTYIDAYATGLYREIRWETDGTESYDGCWYHLVGIRAESDEVYSVRVKLAQNEHRRALEKWNAGRLRAARRELKEYNEVAKKHGLPLGRLDAEMNIVVDS